MKDKGKIIITSTPTTPSRADQKAWSLASAYGSSPRKIIDGMKAHAVWVDECFPDHLWWDQAGFPHKIEEMEDTYLQNCIKMIQEKRIKNRERFLKPMQKELARRKGKLGDLIYGENERVV